jgi:hypothetical protein
MIVPSQERFDAIHILRLPSFLGQDTKRHQQSAKMNHFLPDQNASEGLDYGTPARAVRARRKPIFFTLSQ